MDRHRICRLDEIPNRSSRAFTFPRGETEVSAFVLRLGDTVRAYKNSCRHWPEVPLDAGKGVRWTKDGARLLCIEHGAEYEPVSGDCVRGPCNGASLVPLPVLVEDGEVYIRLGSR